MCLRRCPYALPYACSWWLDIVSPGWYGLVERSGDEYQAVFPIPVKKKFGMHLVRQPLFGHQMGLFRADKEAPDPEEIRYLTDVTCRHFRYVDSLALYGTAELDLPCPSRQQTNYLLDLCQPYESIVAGYAGNRRREITQAGKAGIEVRECYDPGQMLQVFQQYIAPGIYGIDGSEYEMFRALFQKWQAMGCVTVYESVQDGEWLAGAAILRWGHRLIYIFNASTPEGKAVDALSFLIDRVIHKHAASETPLFFDFEAPASDSVLDYYRRFGGNRELYQKVSQNRLPKQVRMLQALRKAWVQRSKR
ncbi:MAG: GNAT family N-acetyltransferase [Cyclobacteriaceae bacterium]